jgi:sterol desaturase/sphingolipid hydroxylase (fatty acid hydroxylase superfamily)
LTETILRLSITLGLFGLLLGLERWKPARASLLGLDRLARHGALAAIGAALAGLLWVGGLVAVADWASSAKMGLFNHVNPPKWVAIVVCFVVLDFAIWGQHWLSHRVPILWRFHRVHHSDERMDVSTAWRFHPIEIMASMIFKTGMIVLLGAPALAVLLFEFSLAVGAMFTHANLTLSPKLQRTLGAVFVTPAMHLIHHSPEPLETNSNYGFSFNIWDRLFHTYRGIAYSLDRPLGLEPLRAADSQSLVAMLKNPFLAS